jgi:hypothetical protein
VEISVRCAPVVEEPDDCGHATVVLAQFWPDLGHGHLVRRPFGELCLRPRLGMAYA